MRTILLALGLALAAAGCTQVITIERATPPVQATGPSD
jgi:hypothetical protein